MFEPQSKRDEINRTNWQFMSPMTIDEFIEDNNRLGSAVAQQYLL